MLAWSVRILVGASALGYTGSRNDNEGKCIPVHPSKRSSKSLHSTNERESISPALGAARGQFRYPIQQTARPKEGRREGRSERAIALSAVVHTSPRERAAGLCQFAPGCGINSEWGCESFVTIILPPRILSRPASGESGPAAYLLSPFPSFPRFSSRPLSHVPPLRRKSVSGSVRPNVDRTNRMR